MQFYVWLTLSFFTIMCILWVRNSVERMNNRDRQDTIVFELWLTMTLKTTLEPYVVESRCHPLVRPVSLDACKRSETHSASMWVYTYINICDWIMRARHFYNRLQWQHKLLEVGRFMMACGGRVDRSQQYIIRRHGVILIMWKTAGKSTNTHTHTHAHIIQPICDNHDFHLPLLFLNYVV